LKQLIAKQKNIAGSNMRKLILLVHTSLDGFVAGEKGEFDNFNPGADNLEFVCSLTEKADAALVGRVSYQMLERFWPTAHTRPNATTSEIKYSNWYNSAAKIIISKTLTETNLDNKTIISEDIFDKIIEIKRQPGKDILMFGSPTTFQYLVDLNLIDDYWIIVYPVFFGKGITLFSLMKDKIKLKVLSTKQLSNGEIALNYTVDK